MGKVLENSRTVKYIIIGLVAAIAVIAAVMFILSMAGSGKDDENSSSESSASATSGLAEEAMTPLEIDTSQNYAKKLYGYKVEDVTDTAAVVNLLETMEMEAVSGKYTATVSTEAEAKVLALTVTEPVAKSDKKVFDSNMTICAKELLALIPEAGKVQWTYSISSHDAEEEVCVVSLDTAGAAEELSKDVKAYGKSAEAFQKLLKNLAGEN